MKKRKISVSKKKTAVKHHTKKSYSLTGNMDEFLIIVAASTIIIFSAVYFVFA